MELSIKQTKALDFLEDIVTNELIFGGGAGGAKSVLGCYWLTKCSLKYNKTRWVIGRAVLKTLKETTLNTLWWVFAEQGLKPGVHYRYFEQKGLIKFFNDSEILLKDLEQYPSDPNFDELGSLEITGAFVDECNQVSKKAWDILKSRIRYRLDEFHIVPKILGTCNPAKNWVFTDFFGPWERKELKSNKQFIQSLLNDNPFISRHYKENLLSLDKVSKERLLYGNWNYSDDPSELCDYDSICDLFTNDHVKGTGIKFGSGDLAMQGRDRFVAGSWDDMVCTIKIDKPKASGKEIEADIKNMMNTDFIPHSRMVVDSDGLGAYLESYLTGIKEFHGGARATNDVEFFNLKSECGFKLAEMVNKKQIKIVCSPSQKQSIIEELGALKRDKIDADDTRKRIIKKELMKELLGRSPDYLDMLLMRMYFVLKPENYLIYSS